MSRKNEQNNKVKGNHMKIIRRNWVPAIVLFAVAVIVLAINVFADPPQPVLTIARTGIDQFSLVITNGVGTNYEVHWTPVLNDPVGYPWTLIGIGATGETNFSIDTVGWPSGFFRVSIEQFYNGIPDYVLADPNNPSLGPLTITIDSPVDGSTVN
jgi:hypothetical protein